MIKFELHNYHTSFFAGLGKLVHLSSHTWSTGSANDISKIHQISINVFQSLQAGRFVPLLYRYVCWSNEEEIVSRGPPAFGRSALEWKGPARATCVHPCMCASTWMGSSLRLAKEKVFIQTITGVRRSLPSWSMGPAKFSRPTTDSSWRRVTWYESITPSHCERTVDMVWGQGQSHVPEIYLNP